MDTQSSKHNWTERLARACARRPWVTLGAWVAAIVLAVMAMGLWLNDALVTEVKPTNNPESTAALDLINSRLGQSEDTSLDEIIIVRSDTYTVDDPQFAAVVNGLYDDIAALGEEAFLGGATYFMTQDPSMVSADWHSTMLPFKMPEGGDEHIAAVYAAGDAYADGDFEVYYTGSASWMADSMALSESTMARGETIGIGAALVILALVFGALAAAVLPIGLGGVAIMAALGLTAVVGTAMDLTFTVTNMITMMGLAVGIDYSLFILTRFREERSKGLSKLDAIGRAGATANRAVFFSGLTVILALSGLVMFPLSIFISMGIGSILVVIAAIAASMTLLPAMISLLGDKVNALRIPFIQKKQAVHTHEADRGFWAGMTRVVTKVPALSLIVAVGLLLAAAVPFLDKESGMTGISGMPDYLPAKQGYLVLQEEFHIGLDTPAMIVIDGDVSDPAVTAGVEKLQAALGADGAFAGTYFQPYPEQHLGVLYATLSGDSMSRATMASVERMRADYVPAAFAGTDASVMVTGDTAFIIDFNQTTSDYTPWIFAFVLGLSFVILILAFRSIVISTTAIIMNLLSVGAAYGLIVLVFQKGVGASLFGFIQVDVIETWLPLFLFALLFGLSMDYHVFLLSRVRERYQETGDNAEAVSFGLRSTGRLITGAALIMVAVFGGFALGDMSMMQQMGFGLAVAVFLDATLVRCVLVPATMKLLGRANWYLPRWLSWLPDISLGEHDGGTVKVKTPKPEKVPARLRAIPVPADDD